MLRRSFPVAVLVFALSALLLIMAVAALADDGRVNSTVNFGGDALYCVDRNNTVSSNWSDGGLGGFRLLSAGGQELWFVPAADIVAATQQAQANPGTVVLIGEGEGTHGPVSLSVVAASNANRTLTFTFTGFTADGKPNAMTFGSCSLKVPTPAPTASAVPTEEVTEDPCERVPAKRPAVVSVRGAALLTAQTLFGGGLRDTLRPHAAAQGCFIEG